MIKRALMAAAVSVFFTTTALAGTCPLMVQEIDAALAADTTLSTEKAAEIKALRDQGKAEHSAGQHGESVATLQKAKDMQGL